MTQNNAFRIDLDKVLRDKSPRHYRKIPRFVINYLKRLVHQEEINGILERNRDLEGVPFMHALVEKEFNLTLKLRGEENIPSAGRFVFASNHPLGGLDGICLSSVQVAAMTVYDMCKAVQRDIRITDCRLTHKSGGKSGEFNEL